MPYPPPAGEQPPAALLYARLYAGAFTVMYGLCVIFGALLLVLAASGSMGHGKQIVQAYINGGAMFFVGLPLAIVSAVAFFGVGKRTKGMWTLNLILHAIGLMSCFCLPFGLALLVAWTKPEVKAWYGA